MRMRKSRLGLSIIAGGLSFVGSAQAIDLITNGSFETTGSWKYFGTYAFSTAYFSGPPIPASENPGNQFATTEASDFSAWDHFVTPTNLTDHMAFNLRYAGSQTVTLTNALTGTAIDAGLGRFTFSCWLSSYGNPKTNPEQPFVALRFYDANTNLMPGNDVIFDRTTSAYATMFASGETSIPADLSNDHQWVKYVANGTIPNNSRFGIVYLTRSPNAPKSNSPDTYMDLVKLNVINANDNTFLEATTPGNATGVNPDIVISANLRDANNQVVTNSIQMQFDGVSVTPAVQKSGTLTTVQYDPPGLLAPLSSHTYKITWNDDEVPAVAKTNQYAFTVGTYLNINAGAPIFLETFDEVAEGSLPSGWAVTNSTDSDLPGTDLNNFHSDSYLDWVVISRSTLSNLFGVVPGGSDYQSTLNITPLQFLNGALVSNLISSNFAFAASSDRFGNQIQYLTSGNYNLSGQTNVHLVFKEIYTQNQDSLGAVEYSIDNGATWLPALYLVDFGDIVLDAMGNIDASNTFATVHGDVPGPGNYGAFIGLAQNQWATATPFISPRANDNLSDSKRVEAVRLAQADNQSTVKLRFTQVGSDSYYFGIDDVGFYNVTPTAPVIVTNPVNTVAAVGNSATLTAAAIGISPVTYQWRKNGVNLSGNTGPILVIPSVQAVSVGNYDVVIKSDGLSVTSSPSVALTVTNPAVMITGQWDFNNGLAATMGSPLQFFDGTVSNDTTFGTTSGFGIGDINGQSANVMHLVPSVPAWGGYKMLHGSSPNGGGAKVNQYTLIYDIYYPSSSSGTYRAFLQAALDNSDDAEIFVNPANGIGISSIYTGMVSPDTWHRIAFAFDLSGPGAHPVLEKFIDGIKVGEQTTGLSGVDGRFSLLPSALLLADNDGDNGEAYVSSIQFSNGRRPDAFIEALGGPTASKIPGFIQAASVGTSIVINWTGGVPLQSADSPAGPWTTVNGATSPFTISNPGRVKFYRPQIP